MLGSFLGFHRNDMCFRGFSVFHVKLTSSEKKV